MVDVVLYFAPFPTDDAIALEVEESPDGVGSWVSIADTSEIGSYPNYITSLVVAATSIDYWFRLRWELSPGAVFTEWSDPVQGSALPEHWTVPDLYRTLSQHKLTRWTNLQLQMLIDRAYFILQNQCGPFDEADPEFGIRAQLAIHSLMDQMLPALSRSWLGGFEMEKMGSYEYRLASGDQLGKQMSRFIVPFDLLALICPFGTRRASVEVSTTHVFEQTPYSLAGTEGMVGVFTAEDRHRLAYGSLFPWWRHQDPSP